MSYQTQLNFEFYNDTEEQYTLDLNNSGTINITGSYGYINTGAITMTSTTMSPSIITLGPSTATYDELDVRVLKVDGHDISETLSLICDRLAILVRNDHEEFNALNDAYLKYKLLEKLVK
jgi:hypothetical protein